MPQLSTEKRGHLQRQTKVFAGFATPTSNTTYTPNQFFDVCLRHCSRGAVRLVSYLLRQTLGWCDTDGNPLHERLQVSYSEFVQKAGVSRGILRRSLDEALRGGFIECVQIGKASSAHSKAESAHYQLRWDSRPEYIKDPERFCGFFEGEGNRTDIPNQFFDQVIRHETLAVSKVVGSIVRFSIGFQAKHGRRRQQVALSYRDIQRYGRISDPTTLAAALRLAEASHYIVQVEPGFFDPNAGQNSRPAVFTLKWADSSPFLQTGSKTLAEGFDVDRFKNPSGTGSESIAENRSKNPSDIQTKLTKETSKQQQAAETQQTSSLLRTEGFSEDAALALAHQFTTERIREQIEWLPKRAPAKNKLGMLRRAIEENWPAPQEVRHAEVSSGLQFARHFYAGLAGNLGIPVAEPSTRDVELASGLIDRLVGMKPSSGDEAALGREFASYVRERRKEGDVASLVLALRLHGDAWLVRFGRSQREHQEAAAEAQRAAHRIQHEAAWLLFVREAEGTCRSDKAAEYASFLERHQSNRWRVTGTDEERARLLAFQRHFEVLDFWHWDAEFNPNPFRV